MTDSGAPDNSLVTGEVVQIRIVDGERIIGLKEANGGIVDIKLENIREIR
jgi:hypothetical protein